MFLVIMIIALVALDQVSKLMIINNVEVGEKIPVINDFFYITHHKNEGIAWSLLENKGYIFIPITIIVTVVLSYMIYKNKEKLFRISLAVILSGAIGNLIDRLFLGSVTDFFEFHFGSYVFPVFNVADICVVLGSVALVIFVLFFYDEEQDKIKLK
ncbi:signal peptidase II [Clostridium cellulovorans]|uniref:Lipoprotein signal peptidase n=1 Tax=Clostridium cellulovorans (strain ATCC 35296 / DSM 3052 / OCM 3 / 743B) TaxID=573061 RepID=D9SM81_CLOC7|nr:signal peptidase II [Clostridium cellulovorans]ADL53737.1 lipoprotein signal peptidase [Clostridium cellulovorans 743B]